MASRARRPEPRPNLTFPILAGSGIAGVAAQWFGYPGIFIFYVGLIAAAWAMPPAQFTGKKDSAGYPTAANAAETKLMERYRFWRELKWRLFMPTGDWLPISYKRWWPLLSWFAAVWAALVVFAFLPYADAPASSMDLPWWSLALASLNAFAAFITVAQLTATRRRNTGFGEPSPGLRLDSLLEVLRNGAPGTDALRVRLFAGVGVAGGLVAAFVIGQSTTMRPGLFLALSLAGFVAGVYRPWDTVALQSWRDTNTARQTWAPRWETLKTEAPFLISYEKLGAATIETFEAPAALGAVAYADLAAKAANFLGGGFRVAFLPVLNTDKQGQPVPGQIHPLRFQYVTYANDEFPNVTDPALSEDEVRLAINSALFAIANPNRWPQPFIADLARINAEGEELEAMLGGEAGPIPSAWMFSWIALDGVSMRTFIRPALSGQLGCEALVDHRSQRGPNGVAYVGSLTGDTAMISAGSGTSVEELGFIDLEDTWNHRWEEVLKQGVNPPGVQPKLYAEAKLPGGETIKMQPFVVRQGIDPADYMNLDSKLATVLNSAPMVTVTGWTKVRGRSGERHAQAICVVWSNDPVPPNPDRLMPPEGGRRGGSTDAQQWVLASMMNKAFTAARLARPEVTRVSALTKPGTRNHIWEIVLRLYGGVTLADVRGASERIRQHLGSEWLRVDMKGEGENVVIVAGVNPRRAALIGKAQEQRVTRLDWDQAWLDSKISGVGGITPKLVNESTLPLNEMVKVLDFELPSGLDFTTVKAASNKLENATRNAYVEVRRGDTAGTVRVMCCEVHPMPESASVDYEYVDSTKNIPFATGIEGEPVEYNAKVDPHLLIAGASGGGKMQRLTARVPVPVSERFPDGWATNGSLKVGDLIYAADGTLTPITAFSDIVTERVYRLTLSDGQKVEAGGHHLWKVSTRHSRSTVRGARGQARDTRSAAYRARAGLLRELASYTGPTQLASLADIARLAGYNELSLYGMRLPIEHLGVALQMPSNRKSRVVHVAAIADYFDRRVTESGHTTFGGWKIVAKNVQGLRDAADAVGGWLTPRAMTDALLGKESDRGERTLMKQILSRQAHESKMGATTFTTNVYPVDELLVLLAERLEYQAVRSDSGREAGPVEVILSTEDMLKNPSAGYGIRRPAPIGGPDADLIVDPYVLGAWLGDGTSHWGTITQGTSAACTDESGLTDRDHLIAQITGHYPAYTTQDPEVIRTRGLTTDLRKAGVLRDKHIPATYLRASHAQRLALLQGLMDTDGSINADGTCELDLCDRRLADGALELVRSLGISATQRAEPAKITEADPDNPGSTRQRVTGTRYRLKFTTGLPVFRLPRKAARLRTDGDLRSTQDWTYIEAIEAVDEAPMRCIAVEHPEHLYLTDEFVPTHNSVALQNFVYGAVVRGNVLYVIDPVKGGADFRFAEPYARAFAETIWQAKGVMEDIYAEVLRRKALNSKHGVGNYRDLPEEVRPPHVTIVMDEFTSLMSADPVPPKSDDPEVAMEREALIAQNSAKAFVGTYTGKIAREARSTGFTLVLATQKLTAKMLDTIPGAGDLKVNLSRMLVGKATPGDRSSALRAPEDAPSLGDAIPAGRGLWETSAGVAEMIQVWFEPSQQVFSENLAARVPVLSADQRLDMEKFGPPVIESQAEFSIIGDGPVLSGPPVAVAEEVIELAEITFSLDDLEMDDEDDEQAPESAPESEVVEMDMSALFGADDTPAVLPEPAAQPQPEQIPPPPPAPAAKPDEFDSIPAAPVLTGDDPFADTLPKVDPALLAGSDDF